MDPEKLLWGLAIASTLYFVIRLFFGLGGAGADDFDGDHHAEPGEVKFLSLLTLATMIATGSWTSLLFLQVTDWGLAGSIAGGTGAGLIAMFLTAQFLSRIRLLEQDGTLREFDPAGLRGEAYVRIPPVGEGEGQVRLEVKGRLRIFRAVNEEDRPIESFRPVAVTGRSADGVLRVRATG